MSFLKRLRSTVGGNQQFYVPILPKPVVTTVPASIEVTALPSRSAVTSVATLTNYQMSTTGDLETDSRTWIRSQPALNFSSSLIGVAEAESTQENQNSGNTVTQTPLQSEAGTILPIQRVNVLQDPISAAARSEAQSFDNTVAQSQLQASSVVNQRASTPAIHDSVSTNTLSLPSQRISCSVDMESPGQLRTPATFSHQTPLVNSFINIMPQRQLETLAINSLPTPSQLFRNFDMVPRGQLPPSATVSQSVSTTPVNGSFDIMSQGQLASLATNSLLSSSHLFNSSTNIIPQGQLPTSSTVSQISPIPPVNGSFNLLPQEQLAVNNSVNMIAQKEVATSATVSRVVSRSAQPFVSENTTLEGLEIPRSAGISDQSFVQSFLNSGSRLVNQPSYGTFNIEQELRKLKAIFETVKPTENGSQEANEALRDLHDSNIASSATLAHASSRIAQSPGLNLLADVTSSVKHNVINMNKALQMRQTHR